MSHISFLVTVTLTSDLVLRIIVTSAYLFLFFEVGFLFGVLMHLGIAECRIPFLGHCDLDL